METVISSQTTLFNEAEDSSFKFMTSRMNLLTVLDAGYVTVSSESWRYSPDSRELYKGLVPLCAGAFPLNFKPIWLESEKDFPVILEFSSRLVEWLPEMAVHESPDDLILVCGILPLSYLERIVFRTSQEKEDFVLRSLRENVPGESYFSIADESYASWSEQELVPREVGRNLPLNPTKQLGTLLTALKFYEFSRSSVELFKQLAELSFRLDNFDINNLFSEGLLFTSPEQPEEAGVRGDKWLFERVIEFCIKTDSEEQFDQDEFTQFIKIGCSNLEEAERLDIEKWLQVVTRVLDADVEVPQLTDNRSIVKRAILLFVLRPSTKRFAAVSESSLHPGSRVKLLASFFLGALSGHQNLEVGFKDNSKLYFDFVLAVLKKIVHPSSGQLLSVCETETVGMEAKYDLCCDGFSLLTWLAKPDPVFAQIYYRAQEAHYEMHFDHSRQRLWTQIPLPGGRKQVVYVTKGKPNLQGDVVLRFYSPCLDLSEKKNRLLRDHMLDLLVRNSDPGMYCRFAVDTELNAVTVAVDQIHSTMNPEELITHIEYIASTADAYELERTGDDQY